MMASALELLRQGGVIDPGVLAAGLERGRVSRSDIVAYAAERLSAGDDRAEVLEIVIDDDLSVERIVELLRQWAQRDGLPSASPENALRRWMYVDLKTIVESATTPEEKLDEFEEMYASYDYPEALMECSRYYVPPEDRARGIRVGEKTASPIEAMNRMLSRLVDEFELSANRN